MSPLTDNPETEYCLSAVRGEVAKPFSQESVTFECELKEINLDALKAITSDDPLDWPLEARPVIYVAGYFSANPMHGTRNAVQWAEALLYRGWLPLVPHTSIMWDSICGHPPEFWYALDLAILERCDFMFVCPDALTTQSKGVTDEIRFASQHDIPILYEVIPAKDRYER